MNELSHVAQVIVQPDEGHPPVLALIAQARRSLRIKQFTFDCPPLIEAVVAAHRRGVAVQVMLNPKRSSGSRGNDATFAALEAAGVPVAWSSPRFAVTHEKSLVADGTAALIATFNFVEKYFTQTRDYGLVVTDPFEVAQVEACFAADWAHEPFHPDPRSALLWSNLNARSVMGRFIDGARETLEVQHPKFVDAVILERLFAARKRGVKVRVICGGKHGISDYDVLDTFASLRLLADAGVRVHKQKRLRTHAKLIIADGRRAQVGSMNIDRSAFDLRRELGVVVADHAAVRQLERVFEADWQDSHRYEPPDPLEAAAHVEDDFAHDADLAHE